ncbi:gliding motility protein GldN [Bacteroidales bacterium OttesenSCG-928-K03]|nr:gliding motility protein GldN [Odoribacter sp. OttesenSCG-928-L07]MDL2238926.1 gliding motility protein GldN [Bacteroidales bacterium OttesenSCG-928-L14]MDL2240964.1 gliding motility protein GldN [Bacteroidales bacterium OttesenSCG-928-K22]MDL2242906.1 gliding motility protein GldN [Bacteroidales bacterium OttesenSCG-928-K03]
MKKFVCYIILIVFGIAFGQNALAQYIDAPRDGFYDRTTNVERKPIPYVYVNESDVMWSQRIWRTLDLRERANQVFYYPTTPQEHWKNLMTVIMDALKDGEITAYDASTTDEFIVPMSYSEVMGKLSSSEKITLQRPYPPYEEYDTIIVRDFNTQDITTFRIKEDWFIDRKRSVMECRIIGICPVKQDIDPNTNEIRGTLPLFWIYYPEARQVMVNSEVFNPKNDSNRLTYDDVFWKRMFTSTIYKKSNTYDRRISEYATELDALLEAERIQNDLRLRESDMWQY